MISMTRAVGFFLMSRVAFERGSCFSNLIRRLGVNKALILLSK
jgi:hypothetical protein